MNRFFIHNSLESYLECVQKGLYFHYIILMRKTTTCGPCQMSWNALNKSIFGKPNALISLEKLDNRISTKLTIILDYLIFNKGSFNVPEKVKEKFNLFILKNNIDTNEKKQNFYDKIMNLFFQSFSIHFIGIELDLLMNNTKDGSLREKEMTNFILNIEGRYVPDFKRFILTSKINPNYYFENTNNPILKMFHDGTVGAISNLDPFILRPNEIEFLSIFFLMEIIDNMKL